MTFWFRRPFTRDVQKPNKSELIKSDDCRQWIVSIKQRVAQMESEIVQQVAAHSASPENWPQPVDQFPPEDPIASLLRDPTLDEILAQLENEQDFLEETGLSARRSNLQIMGDWSSSSGGMSGEMMGQFQQRMRQLSNTAYRNALDRARVKDLSDKPRLAKEDRRWNLLVGKLGEDMLQGDNKIPPERYRSAVEHYSEQISKLKNDQRAKAFVRHS